MSAISLKNIKRDFSQLSYRPDVCHPNFIKELTNILETTGKLLMISCKILVINTNNYFFRVKTRI